MICRPLVRLAMINAPIMAPEDGAYATEGGGSAQDAGRDRISS